MQFKATAPGYVLHVRDEEAVWSGDKKRIIKPVLTIDFGEYGPAGPALGEQDAPMISPFGNRYSIADVRGGFIDTDVLAEQNRWSIDDKAEIEDALMDAATNQYAPAFGDITLYETPKPKAPWSTYDTMSPAAIVKTAAETGFEPEALLYEQLTKKRPEVTTALEELLSQAEELTAA